MIKSNSSKLTQFVLKPLSLILKLKFKCEVKMFQFLNNKNNNSFALISLATGNYIFGLDKTYIHMPQKKNE